MPRKKSVRDIDVDKKTALLRADFNVPFQPGSAIISDDSRIRSTLPTIDYLTSRGARVVACSHLGRPCGVVVDALRMEPIAERLADLLGRTVVRGVAATGPVVAEQIRALPPGGVILLENLRFHPGEERNDPEFARSLAALADVYVNDAFGAAHRAHASTAGAPRFLPSVAGLLMERELEMLGAALERPKRPLAAIVGGAKISDKLRVIERLTGSADTLIIGGGMAATFLKSQGLNVGDSLVEEDLVGRAGDIIASAGEAGTQTCMPSDVVIANRFAADASTRVVEAAAIPCGWRIMDIGPRSVARFLAAVEGAGTVVWNGTMGVAEWEAFSHGARGLAEGLAELRDAVTIIGGGSTAEAVNALGLADRMTHVSTGGGASLEFLEGRRLPGVERLDDADATMEFGDD